MKEVHNVMATRETMTVHEALCEIKVADSKVNSVLGKARFCAPNKASNTKLNGSSIADFTEAAKADFQRVKDIINRTEAIKAALNQSNSTTIIKVGDKEMTVAEGIYMMAHGMDAKKALLNLMKNQYSRALQTIQDENGDKLEGRLDRMIEQTYGSKEKANPEDIKTSTDLFIKQHQYELVDPLGIQEEIQKLEDEILDFQSNVDSALQISNATTNITIEW